MHAGVPVLPARIGCTGPGGRKPPGFYFGKQAGVSLPGEYESTRTNTRSVPTNCDQWLPGEILNDGTPVPLPLVIPGDAKQAEFVERGEKISDFRTDNLFANLHYDFRGMLSPNATPYLGVGAGLAQQNLFYSAVSVRTNDRDRMRQLGRNSHAAGLASLADAKLSDRIFSYQFLAGVDYTVDERFSAGLKLRYGNVGEFLDGENPSMLLRGHESTVGPTSGTGYDMPIQYEITGSSSHFRGIMLSLRYQIGG